MSKHTKGPWVAHDKRPHCGGLSIFADTQYIAFVGDSDALTPCESNARLISAAPELLEELGELLKVMVVVQASLIDAAKHFGKLDESSKIFEDRIDAARAVIFKATGGLK